MKQFALLMGIVIGLNLGASSARAAGTNAALTVRFSLTAYTGKPTVTVTHASSTNSISGLNKTKFGAPDLLNILKTEFSTNFPAGAQLGMTGGFRFVVLDKGGQVLLDASSNPSDSSYVFAVTNNFNGVLSGRSTETPSGGTELLKLLQPDFGVYYADGSGNNFHFDGLALISGNGVTRTNTTVFKTVSLLMPNCSGGGTFFNAQDGQYDDAVFSGVFGASGTNIPESSD